MRLGSIKMKKVEEKDTKLNKEKKTIKKSDAIIISKDNNKIVKFVASLMTFFASIVSIIVFVFGIISTIQVARNPASEAVHDNFSVTFISSLSNNTVEETKLAMLSMDSKVVYILFNIVLPVIAIVCALILLILLSYLLLRFFDGPLTEKKLFTSKKSHQLSAITDVICVIIFVVWALFNSPSFPFVLLIYLLLFIINGLFKKCVDYYNNI